MQRRYLMEQILKTPTNTPIDQISSLDWTIATWKIPGDPKWDDYPFLNQPINSINKYNMSYGGLQYQLAHMSRNDRRSMISSYKYMSSGPSPNISPADNNKIRQSSGLWRIIYFLSLRGAEPPPPPAHVLVIFNIVSYIIPSFQKWVGLESSRQCVVDVFLSLCNGNGT